MYNNSVSFFHFHLHIKKSL